MLLKQVLSLNVRDACHRIMQDAIFTATSLLETVVDEMIYIVKKIW
jgi:hypothetical protein